jgi:hypothetical protein
MTTNGQNTNSTSATAQDAVAEGELSSEQILERTVLYALEQAAEKLGQNGGFDPFTILIEGEELYLEEHPGESEEASRRSARLTVYQMERLCDAYVFCYDGYVELADDVDADGTSGADDVDADADADAEDGADADALDDGHANTRDALVAEYASKGDALAPVIALMYHRHGDHYHFDDTLYQVDEVAPLFGQGSSNAAGA